MYTSLGIRNQKKSIIKKLIKDSIAVMPEITNYSLQDLKICYGICSDNILSYYNSLGEKK